MNLLAFDTSTDVMSIAVQRGAGGAGASGGAGVAGVARGVPEIWQHTGAGGAQASIALIPAILRLMQQADIRFDELDAVAFGRGPGSFTGLRTACSVAQGLAFGAGVPVLPVDTLLAVAEEARHQWSVFCGSDGLPGLRGTPETNETHPSAHGTGAQAAPGPFQVLAVLDARMDEVYAAGYEFHGDTFVQRMRLSLIRPDDLVLQAGWHLAGNAVQAYGSRLPGNLARHLHALPTAHALLRLAPALLAAGQAVSADQALPVYIRDKVAKTTQERVQEKLQKAAT